MQDSIAKLIQTVCDNRDASHAFLEKSSPVYRETVQQRNQQLKGPGRTGGLDRKHKVLANLAVFVAHGAEQNVEFCVSAALQVGASEAEVLDAVDVGLLAGGGLAVPRAQFAANVLNLRAAAGDRQDRFQFVDAVKP